MAFAALMRRLALGALALTSARCAAPMARPPSYVAAPQVLSQGGLFQVLDATGPLSYQTPTPGDLQGYRFLKRARGEVCQNDLHLPLMLEGSHMNAALSGAQTLDLLWGNASVAQGVADALQGAPVGAVLYDLTLDLHKISVFGLFFRRQCLVVSGSLALPWAAPAKPQPVAPAAPGPNPAAAGGLAPGAAPPLVPIAPAGRGGDRPSASHPAKDRKGGHGSRRHSGGHKARRKNARRGHVSKHPGHPSSSHRHSAED
jgi:hypothetical protein